MSQYANTDFLETDISVNNDSNKVEGTDFDSEKIPVGEINKGLISLKFNPAAAAAESIDFEFAISYDNGTTWTSGLGGDAFKQVQINTDVNAISNVVYHSEAIDLYGVTHIKLNRVLVSVGAGNCTEINANLAKAREF
ncbi:MAG TPA: hypothetical protein VFG01_07205 [Acidobacteriota bacterium]|nr:hypothetical protein [Acidobacteriota bacterium]